MDLTLKIWRQKNSEDKGQLVDYKVTDISEHMSFLEMMDVLNEQIIKKEKNLLHLTMIVVKEFAECVRCTSMVKHMVLIRGITTCQLHMRSFKDGDTIHIEPFRAAAFPVIKDLVVDRTSFDRIQQSGGFISVNTSGNTQDANAIPIAKASCR